MSRIALINIDTQQSFYHRDYWQEQDVPAFQQAMLGLTEGCQSRGIPVADIFHVDEKGPFSLLCQTDGLFTSSAGCGFPETRS